MVDCCQDKISPYDIRPQETALIGAAIGLGEWLANLPEATESERAAIAQMLVFLRELPSPPPPGFNAEFGFRYDPKDQDRGHNGSWTVSVCRAAFEIFCCGRSELPEFEWFLCPGAVNQNDLSAAGEWIAQVSSPRALAIPDHSMVIEASTWAVTS